MVRRGFFEDINSRISTYRLRRFVGDVVSLLVSNDPFPYDSIDKIEYLIIKRPFNDSWKPNHFSPVVGHIETEDVKSLRMFPPPWNEERLYFVSGARELREEIIREPSVSSLRCVGKYRDEETNYNVVVLTGDIYGIGTTAERVVIPKTKGTEESSEVHWMTVKQIRDLIEEDKFAGKKSFDMVIQDVQRFIH